MHNQYYSIWYSHCSRRVGIIRNNSLRQKKKHAERNNISSLTTTASEAECIVRLHEISYIANKPNGLFMLNCLLIWNVDKVLKLSLSFTKHIHRDKGEVIHTLTRVHFTDLLNEVLIKACNNGTSNRNHEIFVQALNKGINSAHSRTL